MSHRVLFTDHTFDDLQIEREILNEVDAELIDGEQTNESLQELTEDIDALLVMYDEIDSEMISSATNCQVISRTGIGVNNVDIEAATENNIVVTNVPDYCIPEVADHTLALTLALQRKIVDYTQSVRDGDWEVFQGRPMHRLGEQTWGLVGYGNIARAVSKRAAALGMNRIAFDEYLSSDEIAENGATPVDSISELLESSDVVSVHVPLTEETENLITGDELQMMRDSAYLINCARGGIVNENALAEAIESGNIAGAGLDVLSEEPPGADNPLVNKSRVLITPHTAFSSSESVIELREKAARNVRDVLTGETPDYIVNSELID